MLDWGVFCGDDNEPVAAFQGEMTAMLWAEQALAPGAFQVRRIGPQEMPAESFTGLPVRVRFWLPDRCWVYMFGRQVVVVDLPPGV